MADQREVRAGVTQVEVGRHSVNDLKKKAANGDRLSKEEQARLMEAERPTKTQDRPTGRVTRTGTQVRTGTEERKHAEKWAERNDVQPEDPERGGPALEEAN